MYTRNKEGSTLVALVVTMVAVGLVGGALLTSSTSSRLQRLGFDSVQRALYMAESGESYARARFAADATYLPSGTFTLDNGDQFILTSTAIGADRLVTATGIADPGDPREARRDLQFVLTAPPPPPDPPDDLVQNMLLDNIMVYSQNFGFQGNQMVGPNATVIVRSNLTTPNFNGGAAMGVSTIMVDGNVELDGGSASFGSQTAPGTIYINGNLTLWNGSRNVYGDVYVNGNLRLKDARINGSMYIEGNVELGWTPWLAATSRVYYTGNLIHPPSMSSTITSKFVKRATVPEVVIPSHSIPGVHPRSWYTSRGYVSGGALTSNMRIFADGYSSTSWRPTATNVVIVSTGDITITGLGGSGLTGFLYAPNGTITFGGAFFRGSAISSGDFNLTSGGTTFTFLSITNFIRNTNDIPIPRGL